MEINKTMINSMLVDNSENQNPARPLERLFNSTTARVLDFLILNQQFDYSQSDISRLAEVSSRSLDNILPKLLKEKLVKNTRKSGKSNMYIFNSNSEKSKALESYFEVVIQEDFKNATNPIDENFAKIIDNQRKSIIDMYSDSK